MAFCCDNYQGISKRFYQLIKSFGIDSYLVFKNSISEAFCKFTNSTHICFILPVADSIGTVKDG